ERVRRALPQDRRAVHRPGHGCARRRLGQPGAVRGVGGTRRRPPPGRVGARVLRVVRRHQPAEADHGRHRPCRSVGDVQRRHRGPAGRPGGLGPRVRRANGAQVGGTGDRHDRHERRAAAHLGPGPGHRPRRDPRSRRGPPDVRKHGADGRAPAPERPLRATGAGARRCRRADQADRVHRPPAL
ncbi:MAG: hypothetical protein AVDCRST_MAG10-1528, partial [uncultured Acidimicrobiales bacterium]